MGKVRELLGPLKHREYRNLWVAQLLSELGDWAARLAVGVLVLERTGSPALTGIVVGLSLVAWLGPGQVVASLVDRYGRRDVMVGADLVRGAAFLLMLIPGPIWVLMLLAVLAGLATPSFEGARSAAQVEIVPPEQYGASLALGAVTQDSSMLLGYLLAGISLAVADPTVALGLNGATFLVSALLLRTLPRLSAAGPEEAQSGIRPALRFLLGDALVRRAALLAVAATFSGATAETLVVVFNVETAGPRWAPAALLAGATALTLAVTALMPLKGSPERLLRVGAWTGLLAATAAAGIVVAGGPIAAAAFLVVGILFVVPVPTNIVAGPRIPQAQRAVVMSIVIGAMVGGQAVAVTMAGLVAEHLGAAYALAGSMAPAVLVGAYSLLRGPGTPVRYEDEGDGRTHPQRALEGGG